MIPSRNVLILLLAFGLASQALVECSKSTKAPKKTTTTAPPTKGGSTQASEEPDERAIKDLMNDKADELELLRKLSQAFNNWVFWINDHNGATLNRYRATRLWNYIELNFPSHLNPNHKKEDDDESWTMLN